MKQIHNNKVTDETIVAYYKSKKTLHQTSSELNMSVVTLWRRAKKLNIFWSDLPRNPSNKISLEDILNGQHPYYQTFKLKNRLINEGLKKNICEICGIEQWNDKPINMQLDHINGNSHDHSFKNLRLVCPNCHSQTDTFSGKNK